MVVYMLSTVDNPFNPFRNFKEWHQWDTNAGYHTLSYLARITITSDELSDADQEEALDSAIDEIIRENPFGVHIKVTADDEAPRKVTVLAE